MLNWSEPDLTEFFGVVATFRDDGHAYEYEVSRDGLRLLVTLFEPEGAVCVSLFRDGLAKPLFTVRRRLCTHAHITDTAGLGCSFEAGTPQHPVTEMGIPPILARGVRVYMEPQFQVELIEPRYDAA